MFSETDSFNMLEFLIDNIFVMFGGRVFQQTVGISMGANRAPRINAIAGGEGPRLYVL
jgi:hypothetical protein